VLSQQTGISRSNGLENSAKYIAWLGQGRAGQGRAGQGRAGQGRAGQGRAGQSRAEQGRATGISLLQAKLAMHSRAMP